MPGSGKKQKRAEQSILGLIRTSVAGMLNLVALPFQVYPIHRLSKLSLQRRYSFINSQRDTLNTAAET